MKRITRWVILFALVSSGLVACDPARETATERPSVAPPPLPTPTQLQAIKRAGEPVVRVRIQRGVEKITVTGPTQLQLSSTASPERTQLVNSPIEFFRRGNHWVGKQLANDLATSSDLIIRAVGPSAIQVNSKESFPGYFRLIPSKNTASTAGPHGRFDVVNHVRLETYLPGVLARELYDNWDAAAYLSQAIAARSYAIDRIITDGPGRDFDMENTQASQAYSGKTANLLALRAVADTVGLVLTYNERIVTAYYSSTCGSANQSATDAFGIPDTQPPLNPQTPCRWCVSSQHYSWKTVTHNRQDLSKRIAAWGRENQLTIGSIGAITQIRVAQTNSLGRPVLFHLTDAAGKTYSIRGESFRNACNYSDPKLPLPTNLRLKSSAVSVRVQGDQVHFENGQGFGHCVGLCQFGAQGQARSGRNPYQILAQYYPGATIERAY